jgi:hypothetical protein
MTIAGQKKKPGGRVTDLPENRDRGIRVGPYPLAPREGQSRATMVSAMAPKARATAESVSWS